MAGKTQAVALRVPYRADPIESPVVAYGEGPARIEFLQDDEASWGRVSFESLDSLRVCRGEHAPFDSSGILERPWPWVFVVENSQWLAERYAYESEHYRDAYNFGGDVDEMIRDFRHFVFTFHDQFVEAIAAGIWLESSPERLRSADLEPGHPLRELPDSAVSERFVESGITCQIRANPRPIEELIADARLCSQVLWAFAAELDGTATISWTVRVRTREGRAFAQLCQYFGNVVEEFRDIPTVDDVRPWIREWLAEVSTSRRDMGRR